VPLPPGLGGAETLELELSTEADDLTAETLAFTGRGYRMPGLRPAEGRAYRIRYAGEATSQEAGA